MIRGLHELCIRLAYSPASTFGEASGGDSDDKPLGGTSPAFNAQEKRGKRNHQQEKKGTLCPASCAYVKPHTYVRARSPRETPYLVLLLLVELLRDLHRRGAGDRRRRGLGAVERRLLLELLERDELPRGGMGRRAGLHVRLDAVVQLEVVVALWQLLVEGGVVLAGRGIEDELRLMGLPEEGRPNGEPVGLGGEEGAAEVLVGSLLSCWKRLNSASKSMEPVGPRVGLMLLLLPAGRQGRHAVHRLGRDVNRDDGLGGRRRCRRRLVEHGGRRGDGRGVQELDARPLGGGRGGTGERTGGRALACPLPDLHLLLGRLRQLRRRLRLAAVLVVVLEDGGRGSVDRGGGGLMLADRGLRGSGDGRAARVVLRHVFVGVLGRVVGGLLLLAAVRVVGVAGVAGDLRIVCTGGARDSAAGAFCRAADGCAVVLLAAGRWYCCCCWTSARARGHQLAAVLRSTEPLLRPVVLREGLRLRAAVLRLVLVALGVLCAARGGQDTRADAQPACLGLAELHRRQQHYGHRQASSSKKLEKKPSAARPTSSHACCGLGLLRFGLSVGSFAPTCGRTVKPSSHPIGAIHDGEGEDERQGGSDRRSQRIEPQVGCITKVAGVTAGRRVTTDQHFEGRSKVTVASSPVNCQLMAVRSLDFNKSIEFDFVQLGIR
uniref:Uncharacterized protein n=1 Tax=Anopheles atroparvus TaxID=41427 RepID=A0A182IR57_ANOAO